MLEPVTPTSAPVKVGDKFVVKETQYVSYTVTKVEGNTFRVVNSSGVDYGGEFTLKVFKGYHILRYRPSYKKLFIAAITKE